MSFLGGNFGMSTCYPELGLPPLKVDPSPLRLQHLAANEEPKPGPRLPFLMLQCGLGPSDLVFLPAPHPA